jgi:hypothetical protein
VRARRVLPGMRRPAGLLFAVLPLLAGCAQPGATVPPDGSGSREEPVLLGTHAGLPDGVRPPRRLGQPVATIVGRGRLALTTWGSSSCPTTPVRAEAAGPDALRVVLGLAARPGEPCTADLGPTTARLGVDPALTRDGRVEVVVVFPQERNDVRVVARPLSGS